MRKIVYLFAVMGLCVGLMGCGKDDDVVNDPAKEEQGNGDDKGQNGNGQGDGQNQDGNDQNQGGNGEGDGQNQDGNGEGSGQNQGGNGEGEDSTVTDEKTGIVGLWTPNDKVFYEFNADGSFTAYCKEWAKKGTYTLKGDAKVKGIVDMEYEYFSLIGGRYHEPEAKKEQLIVTVVEDQLIVESDIYKQYTQADLAYGAVKEFCDNIIDNKLSAEATTVRPVLCGETIEVYNRCIGMKFKIKIIETSGSNVMEHRVKFVLMDAGKYTGLEYELSYVGYSYFMLGEDGKFVMAHTASARENPYRVVIRLAGETDNISGKDIVLTSPTVDENLKYIGACETVFK